MTMWFEIGGRDAVLVNGKLDADYLSAKEMLFLGADLQPTQGTPEFVRISLDDGSSLLLKFEERGHFIQDPETGQFAGSEPGPGHGEGEGGDGGGKGESPGKGYSSEAKLINGVIHTGNVHDAALALFEDRKVELKQPDQVSTLIFHLGDIAKTMIAAGEKAPKFNLCNVSVAGTNLFCTESKGIPRIKMPQLKSVPDFVDHLHAIGYDTHESKIFAAHLRATQDQLGGSQVAAVATKMRNDPGLRDRQIIVSADNYILDGHHTWAAKIGLDAEDGNLTNDTKMNIIRVNIGIIPLYEEAMKYTGGEGAVDIKSLKNRGHFIQDPATGLLQGSEPGPGHGEGEGGEGGGGKGSYGFAPGDVARFQALKGEWAKVNNDLLENIDKPDGPESRAAIDKLEGIVKEIHGLHADPGTPAGVGLPGGPRDVVIVGAGPGGLSAGINGAYEGLDTLVVEANSIAGGQAKFSSRLENFGGWPIGVTGEKLTQSMFDQAQRLGAEIKLGTRVTSMTYDPGTGLKHLTLSNGEHIDSRTVILAGGVEFRRMSYPGSEGSGVIVADPKALAKAAAGGNVCVVGGSNGAAQAALGCARFAEHVYVLARSPLRDKDGHPIGGMSQNQIDALFSNPKITVIESDSIARLFRDEHGNPQILETTKGQRLPVNAVGEFIGGLPDTKWVPTAISLGKGGAVKTNTDLETSIPGVYAAGDVREGVLRRVGAAYGEGQIALSNAYNFLDKLRGPKADKKQIRSADKKDDAKATTLSLITRVFDLDRANPWFGQTVEDVKPPTPKKKSIDGLKKADLRTLYVNRALLNSAAVSEWAKSVGFDTVLEDMHVTIAFSKKPVDWSETEPDTSQLTVVGDHRSLERFDGGAVVLRFESSELEGRWREFKAIGASWDFPSYKPHVTLSYEADNLDLEDIEPYSGELLFGPEEFDEIDPDWKDNIEERAFDPSEPRDEHGRWTDGGGSDSSDSSDGAYEGGGAPSINQLKDWMRQISDRQTEIEQAGQVGSHEDDNLQQMSGAVSVYLRQGMSEPNVRIQVAKDGDKLVAAVSTRYFPDVTSISYAGGLKQQALSAALQLARLESVEMGARRIEGQVFVDDKEKIKAYEDAGYRQSGGETAGVVTMISGEETTQKERQDVADAEKAHWQMVGGMASSVAKDLGFDPAKIVLAKEGDPDQNFVLNGKQFKAGGVAFTRGPGENVAKGTIKIWPGQVWDEKSAEKIAAHEIEHIKFQNAMDRYEKERDAVMKDPGPPPNPEGQYYWEKQGGADAVMKPDGLLRPPYDQKYPIYSLMYPALHTPTWEDFEKGDGVSKYSEDYWTQWRSTGQHTVDFLKAQHETLSEMAAAKYTSGKFPDHKGATAKEKTDNARIWRFLYRAVDAVQKIPS